MSNRESHSKYELIKVSRQPIHFVSGGGLPKKVRPSRWGKMLHVQQGKPDPYAGSVPGSLTGPVPGSGSGDDSDLHNSTSGTESGVHNGSPSEKMRADMRASPLIFSTFDASISDSDTGGATNIATNTFVNNNPKAITESNSLVHPYVSRFFVNYVNEKFPEHSKSRNVYEKILHSTTYTPTRLSTPVPDALIVKMVLCSAGDFRVVPYKAECTPCLKGFYGAEALLSLEVKKS
jgi:hypothetical protein